MVAGVLVGAVAGVLPASSAHAQTVITVGGGVDPGTTSAGVTQVGTLSAAIAEVNAAGGAGPPYTIEITGNITLEGPLSPILNSVTIVGNGNTITADNTRIFMVGVDTATMTTAQGNPPTTSSIISQRQEVSISGLTLSSGVAQGGAGGPGGGGGLGAGGALFVNQSADVTLSGVSFTGNKAVGGAGGTANGTGGGGGLGGNGASVAAIGGGGGGGGGIFGSVQEGPPQEGGSLSGAGLFGNSAPRVGGGGGGGGGYSGNSGQSGNLPVSGG
jgi:hypothetical protein